MNYIDRDALGIGYADRNLFNEPAYADGWNSAIKLLKDAPSVDVAPIRHGEWVQIDKYDKESNVYCSNCLQEFSYIDGVCYLVTGFRLPHYCPNCGAKMDECYLIENIPAADAIEEPSKPRWIPVTEQLPIRGDRVLCFGDNGINTVDFVCGDKWCALPWFYLDGEQETGVAHWMPLPQPPKGE